MHRFHLLLQWLFLFIFLFEQLFDVSHGDVGTAAQYSPPYTPTACFNIDASQFPSTNLFASAGEGIWDDGAACGRLYLVRCISAVVPKTCIPGQLIRVKIIDRAISSASKPSKDGVTMVLSTIAFQKVANASASSISVEFQEI